MHCEDHPGEKLNIATTKDGDQAIWYGDAVEVLLETDAHSYYQIAVNPAGALVDLDRGANRANWFNWSSLAEVATQAAEDHWTVEIRIPVTQDENDPLHRVIGRKPTLSLPWHINVCRQRIRENGSESSAFSPPGVPGFHHKMKFAHFYHGLSHKFEVDPTVTDYVLAARKARRLMLTGKREEALAAYVALAADETLTDLQKSDALQRAAALARGLRDLARAWELADQIPIEAAAKSVRMENMLAERKPDAIIEQFGGEDLGKWPFWQVGAGAFARGKAHMFKKAGGKAEADFQTALAYTSDPRVRINILTDMGANRERNLKDEDAALEAYRRNFESKERVGAADEFRSVDRAARILTRQGKFSEAFDTINRANVDKLNSYWKRAILLSLGNTQAAAGRTAEALTTFRKVLADERAHSSQRQTAKEAIDKLGKKSSALPLRR